ncbi:branched-chain amino acid ABC transporter substrate-binding protein [Deinococcus aquiradiocola]|uniref:Branched chain amino acid ABC transporter substrate-binding protein n=1 Tax=Deinococcus aquiradiocola TaxID=393059 RepID=A0A917PGC2_9DEIO|nr:branched-chain amino acid ABC transporter substrate-binding protein [Deinococcus aquiradiocola]GGJ76148.1 branched chain amino acid ABC transporter substrate-binding protein [Deinococcus aquiradiocola]
MTHRTLTLTALTALLTLGAAQALPVIKLATLSPLSGGQSDQGLQIRNATQLAVAAYQARFKAAGFELQLVTYDDQADPTTGTALARRIAADPAILALIGTYNSGVAVPVSDVLLGAHIPMITPSATGVKVTARGLPNVNRVVARDDAQGSAIGKFIATTLKAKKVYMLDDKTAYGQGLASEVEKYLRAHGVTILASEGTEEKSDFSSIISKIKALNPDAVFFGGIFNQGAPFVKQLRESGVTSAVMGGDGWDSSEFQRLAGSTASGVMYTATAAPASSLPKAATFAALYRKTFNADVQGFGVTAYDAANIALGTILNLARKSGGKVPDHAAVEAGIRASRTTGLLSGTVQFDKLGDRLDARIFVIRIQPDLSIKVVDAVSADK